MRRWWWRNGERMDAGKPPPPGLSRSTSLGGALSKVRPILLACARKARAGLRYAQPERFWDILGVFWDRLRTKRGATLVALALSIVTFAVVDYATLPPQLPGFATVRAAWRPSEAWLYDRNGQLIDSARVDFSARRLAWTPRDRV